MEQPINQKNNAAKFAFFYLLSLVALMFMALSAGMIIFQIINKNIVDAISGYSGRYSSDSLKFAISAIIISAPIYYSLAAQINKNLFSGALDKDSQIRKWLTYFTLLISSVVMIGWLIAVIFNFLDGELTIKFILKAITAIFIAAAVFTYYFYDIKRQSVVGVKDNIVRAYFYGSLIIIIAVLISAFVFVETPKEARYRKHDEAVLRKFNTIDNAINTYYNNNNKLPVDLDTLLEDSRHMSEEDLIDPITKNKFDYNITGEDKFEFCADFKSSNQEQDGDDRHYLNKLWKHDKGYQCLSRKAVKRPKIID